MIVRCLVAAALAAVACAGNAHAQTVAVRGFGQAQGTFYPQTTPNDDDRFVGEVRFRFEPAVKANPWLGFSASFEARRDNIGQVDHDWTLDSLREVTLHCIDCFGTDRAMFASDFPVAGLHASFDEVWESFKAITASFPRGEQEALFFRSAQRVYRIEGASSA